VWQQAKDAATAASHPSAGGSSAGGSRSGSETDLSVSSETDLSVSSPASSASSLGSRHGGFVTSVPDGASQRARRDLPNAGSRPRSAGVEAEQQDWDMRRSATSRAAGALVLKSSRPAREISTHLRVGAQLPLYHYAAAPACWTPMQATFPLLLPQAKKVQELVVAIIRKFTEAYGPLILVLGEGRQ
jgi:hypothetical protein